jgi:hypothetical protein
VTAAILLDFCPKVDNNLSKKDGDGSQNIKKARGIAQTISSGSGDFE